MYFEPMRTMATILFLGAGATQQLISLQGQRCANFSMSLLNYPFRVINVTLYNPECVYPFQVDPQAITTQDPIDGSPISADIIWTKLLKQLPAQIDILFVIDASLWELAQKIKAIPAYRNTPLVVDLSNQGDIPEALNQADHVFVSSERLFDAAKRQGVSTTSLIRDGVRAHQIDNYFLIKWKARLPRYPWTLSILPESSSAAYEHAITSFGGSLGCLPIDSRAVFLGGDPYVLTKKFKECTFGELNLSRLQTLGVLPESDCAAVTQLCPVFALGDFSGDEHFSITAQALYSQARIVAYRSNFIGFESYLGSERIVLVDNASQFRAALRSALTQTLWRPSRSEAIAFHEQQYSLSAAACFREVPRILLNLLGKS